jgi:dipeptidyl aminopeptidase/acylaminoacyl peptidase
MRWVLKAANQVSNTREYALHFCGPWDIARAVRRLSLSVLSGITHLIEGSAALGNEVRVRHGDRRGVDGYCRASLGVGRQFLWILAPLSALAGRSRFRRRSSLALFLSLAVTGTASGAAAETNPPRTVPLLEFFHSPTMQSPELSPDGSQIAFLGRYEGHQGLGLLRVGEEPAPSMVIYSDEGDLSFFFWKGNGSIVYGANFEGRESYTVACRELASTRSVRLRDPGPRNGDLAAWRGSGIVDTLGDDDSHVAFLRRGIARVDVRTGRGELTYPLDGRPDVISEFVLGADGELRIEGRILDGNLFGWDYRKPGQELFAEIARFPRDGILWEPVFLSRDDHTLYILSNVESDMKELRTIDCLTGKLGPVLFHSDLGDVTRVIADPKRRIPLAVEYSGDRENIQWFEGDWANRQARIDAAFPGRTNRMVSWDRAEKRFIVSSESDRSPPVFYLYDIAAGRISALGSAFPTVHAREMCQMLPIEFKARDGLMIHGYLTRPLGRGSGPGPLIIHPHGGPFGYRDTLGFNPEVQMLANRGYSVLQVNYRGSGGYGARFQMEGMGQWGRKMQDDLTDSVEWAVSSGIADPKRVCIYGASYGGYAALCGVTLTPELYKCGVNYLGVADLEAQAYGSYTQNSLGDEFAKIWYGGDKATLAQYSPVKRVEAIRVPTFHAYGENDSRVDIGQWKTLKRELDRYHKTYRYLRLDDEGHGFSIEKDRLLYNSELEQFLKENL